MKKLLGIIVLGLLFCNVGFAELIEMNKCFMSKKDHREFSWTWEEWASRADQCSTCEFKIEDNIFSINPKNGTVTHLLIFSDEYVDFWNKKVIEEQREDPKAFEEKYGQNFPTLADKYRKTIYNIVDFSGSILSAEKMANYGKIKLDINLNTHKVIRKTFRRIETSTNRNYIQVYNCNVEDTSIASGITSGTAFFINNRGNLLTNNHVVEGCKSQKINYFNKEYDTKLIATDKTLDLALLKANVRPKSFISFSRDEPKKRQVITAAGYPLGKYLSDDLKINDGRISALKGFENNTNQLQHDIAINPGNSGGPIINEKGQLVAIAVSGMAKDVTEGLNFGIKASAAANFLKSNKISPSVGYMSFSTSDDKLVKLLEESTVYTFCK